MKAPGIPQNAWNMITNFYGQHAIDLPNKFSLSLMHHSISTHPGDSPGWRWSLQRANYEANLKLTRGTIHRGERHKRTNEDRLQTRWHQYKPSQMIQMHKCVATICLCSSSVAEGTGSHSIGALSPTIAQWFVVFPTGGIDDGEISCFTEWHLSYSTHVCYIFLHLVYLYGKCR